MKFVKIFIFTLAMLSYWCCAEVPAQWANTSYSYETQGNTLSNTLQDFATAFGLQTQFSGEFEQVVKGKFRAKSAIEFLERLALEYRFSWFVFSGKLYIANLKDHQVKRIEVGELTAGTLKKALTAVGLLDQRFGWGELPSENIVLISGPSEYVKLVQNLAKGKQNDSKNSKILTFKLRHASVSDRTIRYRDRSIVIPGVASVLNQVLKGNSTTINMSKPTQNQDNRQTQTRAAGLEAIDKFKSLVGGGNKGKTLVTADVRNNLLLVSLEPKNRSYIQGIINKLDVPLQLMDISAIIVDVSSQKLRQFGINWLFADNAEPISANGALLVRQLSDFLARLHALQSQGQINITASPSVMTQENHPAVIDLSQSVHQSATGERVAEFNKVTAGTSLQVIPRIINRDGERAIQLVVDIEDGKLLPAINQDLVVQSSTISTQAVIQDGHALVLGGFTSTRHEQQHQHIPYLNDIPMLNKLFNYDSNQQSQQQRLFILIPRFIQTDIASALPQPRNKLIEPVITNNTIERAFYTLADGFIPAGFQTDTTPTTTLCQKLHDDIEFTNAQYLKGQHFKLAIALTEGRADGKIIAPQLCEGQGVLAVSFWPPQPLTPGQKSEVFIAYQ